METELMEDVVEVVASEKCPLRLAVGVVAVAALTGVTVVAIKKLKQRRHVIEAELDDEAVIDVEVEITED